MDVASDSLNKSRARSLPTVLPSVIDTAEQGQAKTLSTPWARPVADHRAGSWAARCGRRSAVWAGRCCSTNLALHVAGRHGHAVMIASMECPGRVDGLRRS